MDDALGADDDVLGAVATLEADAAALHRDGAGEGGGHLGLVGDDDDRGAELVAEAVDQLDDVVAVLVGELAGRLVGEQELGAGADRAGQGEALALTAGHRGDDLVDLAAEADLVEEVLVGEGLLALRPGDREPGEAEVLPRGGVGQQVAGRALEHRGDAAGPDLRELELGHPGDLDVTEEDAAGAGLLDAAEEGEQGRLARAAGSEEGHPLACRDREVDALQRDDVVPLEGAVEVDDALAPHAHPATGVLVQVSGVQRHAHVLPPSRGAPAPFPTRHSNLTRCRRQLGSGSR